MNSNIKSEAASTSITAATYDSDEESFVVLERESMRYDNEVNSTSVQSIDNYIGLVSKQLDETTSIMAGKNENVSTTSLDDIQNRVVQLLEENKQLKDTLAQNNVAIKNQMEIICTWQLEMQKAQQNHKEKFAETKVYIDGLKKENMNLKDKLKEAESKMLSINSKEIQKETTQQYTSVDGTLRKQYETLTEKELEAAQKKICELETTLKMIQLTNPHEELVSALKKQIAQTTAANEQLKQGIDMLKGEFAKKEEQFWKDIEQLRKRQAENTKNENIQELLQNLRLQLMEAQEKITSLNCEKQEVEASFRMKVNQLAELQKIHNEAVEEIETVPVLKLQLDVYKTDFEAEKDLARSMKTEKEKIAEDLNIIQNRNEQLLREIEQLRGTLNITNAPNTSNASSNSNFQNLAPKQTSPPSVRYSCPICMRKFKTHKLVTEHVDYCLSNQ